MTFSKQYLVTAMMMTTKIELNYYKRRGHDRVLKNPTLANPPRPFRLKSCFLVATQTS